MKDKSFNNILIYPDALVEKKKPAPSAFPRRRSVLRKVSGEHDQMDHSPLAHSADGATHR
jgi:hypothetical protein